MDSRYGVIVCPRCGMAKGVETSKKTTSCQCGRDIDVSRVKIRYGTDSPIELADLVAQANATLKGGGPVRERRRARKGDPYVAIAERARPVKDPLERMWVVAQGLTELHAGFTVEDLRRVSSLLGRDSAEDMLARLNEHNLVYETAPETYRCV